MWFSQILEGKSSLSDITRFLKNEQNGANQLWPVTCSCPEQHQNPGPLSARNDLRQKRKEKERTRWVEAEWGLEWGPPLESCVSDFYWSMARDKCSVAARHGERHRPDWGRHKEKDRQTDMRISSRKGQWLDFFWHRAGSLPKCHHRPKSNKKHRSLSGHFHICRMETAQDLMEFYCCSCRRNNC
jgi:hypothetical protein